MFFWQEILGRCQEIRMCFEKFGCGCQIRFEWALNKRWTRDGYHKYCSGCNWNKYQVDAQWQSKGKQKILQQLFRKIIDRDNIRECIAQGKGNIRHNLEDDNGKYQFWIYLRSANPMQRATARREQIPKALKKSQTALTAAALELYNSRSSGDCVWCFAWRAHHNPKIDIAVAKQVSRMCRKSISKNFALGLIAKDNEAIMETR